MRRLIFLAVILIFLISGKFSFAEISNEELLKEKVTIEDFDRHLDAHLLHREEGYMMLGGLRTGLGATFVMQGTDNANGGNLSGRGEGIRGLREGVSSLGDRGRRRGGRRTTGIF